MRHWFFLFCALLWATPGLAAHVRIACGSTGQEFALCKSGAEIWAKRSGHTVELVSVPKDSNERLALYQQLLAAQDASIDVFQIDVVWPGVLAHHLRDLTSALPAEERDAHFPAILHNNTVKGQLIAIPWYTDAGMLYYRKDLLEKYGAPVPETWEELTATATRIQAEERKAGDARFWGYVWQGRAYEGLTCNATEWLDSYRTPGVVSPDGQITVNSPEAIAALNMASGWVDTISPKGVLNYAEEEARGVFQSGHALFMRNWPYAWNLAQTPDSPVKDKVGVAPLPKGGVNGKHTGTLGGWQLSVSRYSKEPDAAISLIAYLTGAEEQKRRAIAASYSPTRPALYDDPDVLAAVPLFGTMKHVLMDAVARPSSATGRKYNQVSSGFWNAAHATLAHPGSAAEQLTNLERRLTRLSHAKGWQ